MSTTLLICGQCGIGNYTAAGVCTNPACDHTVNPAVDFDLDEGERLTLTTAGLFALVA